MLILCLVGGPHSASLTLVASEPARGKKTAIARKGVSDPEDVASPEVFCGCGGDELLDPLMKTHIEGGVGLLQRLSKCDQEQLRVSIRGFKGESHDSVLQHVLGSSIRQILGGREVFSWRDFSAVEKMILLNTP